MYDPLTNVFNVVQTQIIRYVLLVLYSLVLDGCGGQANCQVLYVHTRVHVDEHL